MFICLDEFVLNTVRHERPFDLHALSTPPAFILSQDQTLKKNYNRDNSKKLNEQQRVYRAHKALCAPVSTSHMLGLNFQCTFPLSKKSGRDS